MKLTDQEQVILKAIGSGVAEVSRVIRSVGYPKATVKKVLLRLSEKGVVSLHRHDWPASLTPEQRKLMVRIGRDYFNAVSMRKRNPKSKGKTALKKTGRALKGFARGALQSGAEILGAGAMALNPAKKRKRTAKKKPNKTIIKAKRIDHLDVSKVHNPRKRKAKRNAARATSSKPSKTRRAGVSRQTGRKKATGKVRSVAKTRKVTTRRASKRTIKRRNPSITRQQALVYAKDLLAKGNKPLIVRAALHGHGFNEKSALEIVRKAAYLLRNAPKRNPSAESIRKTFAGSINGERDLYFPQGTPAGKLAKLGKLVSITTEAGTIKPVHGTAWLCADTRGKLHIGSTSNAPLFDGPARSFGHVTKLEYESSKPHLGYGPTIWFHRAGEEDGIRPSLYADGKGGLKFRGGNYRLTERGIEN